MTAPLILGTNSIKDTGYNVANSLRFDSGSSTNLTRTPSGASNRKTFTWSLWFKRTHDNAESALFCVGSNTSSSMFMLRFDPDKFNIFGHGSAPNLSTNALFRDPTAWYHVVVAVDTTQGTASNRVKLYVNGTQITSFAAETYPSQDADLIVNSTTEIVIGERPDDNAHFSGYIAELVFIDGSALAPTSFGEFDEDSPRIWKPKNVSSLTFGTNGFYLEFKESGTSANSSGMGADTSGNNHHFAVNNLTSVDQSTDTCTNNFATMNSLDNNYASTTFTEGNLKMVTGGSSLVYNVSTIGFDTGKWYMEVKVGSSTGEVIGVVTDVATANDNNNKLGNRADGWGYDYRGLVENAGADEGGSFATYASGNIIGVYADLDNNKLYFAKDGVLQNSGTGLNLDVSGSPTYFFAVGDNHASNSGTFEVNFGSPTYSISSGNTDGEYGNFEYSTTITGDSASKTFKALNTKNLAEFG
tara:strand:- start:1145 stop:2557 length:1413 start_codon:yes stop_codon:yes gene_type:complete